VRRVDVPFQELTRRRIAVDVDLFDLDLGCVQKTSGILAGRSGGFRIEDRFRHPHRIIETANAHHQRDLLLDSGRIDPRGARLRLRPPDGVRSSLHVV
jgi:hypothetical protein